MDSNSPPAQADASSGARKLAVPKCPRIIHQTWKHTHLSKHLEHCRRSFLKLNPGWAYRFYTDNECDQFVSRYFPELYQTYSRFPPGILRADVFRVLVLFHSGGVYADVDVECLRPLDELLEEVEGNQWEILLTTDHPIHQRHHYGDRVMWMNDFIVSKPGSVFLSAIIEEFRSAANSAYRPEQAVQVTGPGLFSTVIERYGSPAELGVRFLPWQWIHPIPDMTLSFPEREDVERMIFNKSWREGFRPFVVHYWHHTWSANLNTLTQYAPFLLQTDGELVETRLQQCFSEFGDKVSVICRGLAEFAEQGGGTILELSSRLSHSITYADDREGIFLNIAREALNNLDVRYIRVDIGDMLAFPADTPFFTALGCEAPDRISGNCQEMHVSNIVPQAFLSNWIEPVGLIYIRLDAHPERGRKMHELYIQRILLGRLVRPGGYIILECLDEVAESSAFLARAIAALERGGFAVVENGVHVLLHLANFPIPKEIHVIPAGGAGAPSPTVFDRWLDTHKNNGWRLRRWNDEAILAFLSENVPHELDSFLGFRRRREWRRAASYVIAREFGGVVVEENFVCDVALSEVLQDKPLVFFVDSISPLPRADTIVSDRIFASIRGHSFWNGIECDLRDWRAKSIQRIDQQFLAQRIRDSVRFLTEGEAPVIVRMFNSHVAKIPTLNLNEPDAAGRPTSTLCNEADFSTPWFHAASAAIGEPPRYHRKLWEHCFSIRVLAERVDGNRGMRCLIFATETDPVIAAAINLGYSLTVIDFRRYARLRTDEGRRPPDLFPAQLSPRGAPALFSQTAIELPEVDPELFGKFDVIISSGALRCCSNPASARKFLSSALKALSPVGTAVFMADYCVSKRATGLEREADLLFSGNDLESLSKALAGECWQCSSLITIGKGEIESQIDVQPYGTGPHLRVRFGEEVATSLALVIHRCENF